MAPGFWAVEVAYPFKVRFVASESIALCNFLCDLSVIVAEFKGELDYADTTVAEKAKVTGWLRKMSHFKFVASLIVMTDIHEANKSPPVGVQSDQ